MSEWTQNEQAALFRIAKGLREFGYPDVTVDMVEECVLAIRTGESVPHGIVGMMIERNVRQADVPIIDTSPLTPDEEAWLEGLAREGR